MGFFDWFRRRPRIAITAWLDDAGRMAALVEGVRNDLAHGAPVLLTAHFRDDLLAVGQQLAAAGVPFTTKTSWSEADGRALLAAKTPTAVALLVDKLPNVPEAATRPEIPAGSPTLSLRLVGLHVLAAENARVERYAASLPCRVRLATGTSFDDPLMQSFGRPWLKPMLMRMGLKPGECIESAMVTRTMFKLLRKLERGATGNQKCDSLAAWLQRNVPSR